MGDGGSTRLYAMQLLSLLCVFVQATYCLAFIIPDQSQTSHTVSCIHKRKGRLRDWRSGAPSVTTVMAVDDHFEFDKAPQNATKPKAPRRAPSTRKATTNSSSTTKTPSVAPKPRAKAKASKPKVPKLDAELVQKRMTQLESLVASQAVQIKRLQDETKRLREQTATFAQVIDMLRQAGLKDMSGDDNNDSSVDEVEVDTNAAVLDSQSTKQFLESIEESIFGKAPSSVIEAADAAGAAILAGVLAGKKRLLVDVRDAELNTNVETLVQFIELAILPVAAGLEGMNTKRNRLKVVFPTVSQLLDYRKRMALSAPEVVALSTLGFDPVEQRDNLVVLVAPPPDDEEGLAAMNELLEPTQVDSQHIDQPLVVLNHHMVPLAGPSAKFEVAYHLRLLSVQYVSGEDVPEDIVDSLLPETNQAASNSSASEAEMYDAAVEAAMEHAKAVGANHGVTRAMVIRAFPKPWHVFVDLSPDTDADFEVAATFDEEPTQEEVNRSIVECLEGSEEEDELVAQQMQQALENGQLDRVTEMLGSMGLDFLDEEAESDDDNDEGETWDLFGEDSV